MEKSKNNSRSYKFHYPIYIVLITVVLGIACNQSQDPKTTVDQTAQEENQQNTVPEIKIDGIPLQVEIVQDAESRQLGLMYREKLEENHGMLFVFESTQILSFWMRNTFIPLDIAFIDAAGVIVDIQRMEPLDESKQYISAAPALYALEVNAGWFEKNGVNRGSNVQF